MPSRRSNSPYAGFDPNKDPYLKSIPKQTNFTGAGDFFKGNAAGLLGLPADVLELMVNFRGMPGPLNPSGNVPDVPLTSEKVGGLLGADTQSQAFNTGLLGAPDPSDFSRLGVGLLGHTMFHGTPHKFDKFSLDAIGTGEGAQAFGHGLYFAEDAGVAGSYKNVNTEMLLDGKPFSVDASDGFEGLDNLAVLALRARNGNVDDAIQYADTIDPSIADQLRNMDRSRLDVQQGHLYEVEIPDETTAKMLDFDKPFVDQPDELKNLFGGSERVDPNNRVPTQLSYQRWLENSGISPEQAAQELQDAGYPGIRFLDGSSRSGGGGTRNIVVFNPDDITQVKRDSELVFKK